MKQIIAWLILFGFPSQPLAEGVSGSTGIEWQHFSHQASHPAQFDDNLTFTLEPRWENQWNHADDAVSVELFLRVDQKDNQRHHGDIRELLWLHLDGDDEWRVGLNTLSWGVTESQHLVDIVNQVDNVEGVGGKKKLGQPMLHLKHYTDPGTFDFLLLAGFRERTFPALEGRLRAPLVVDMSMTKYESMQAENHIDYAIRYSGNVSNLDFGMTVFDGTNRDPQLLPGMNKYSQLVLVPYYRQMIQLGIDMLYIDEDWMWKLEIIDRKSRETAYQAFTGGFEYTFYDMLQTGANLGTLVEYSYDNRIASERGIYDRDLFLGMRLTLNDVQSSELLAGFVIDTNYHSQICRIEANRRIDDRWKASAEIVFFSQVDNSDPLAMLANEDYFQLRIARYF